VAGGEGGRQVGLRRSVYYRAHARGIAARWAPALTSFVGRETELRELRRLAREARLLTLTGPPGCGKTRLAQELLAAAAADHPGGAHFVPLAPLRDPALVLPTIAEVVGVRPAMG